MKSRYLIILCLITILSPLYSQDSTASQMNSRAIDDFNTFPAISIYYGLKALDKSSEDLDGDEYLKSLYVVARGYGIIDEFQKRDLFLNRAYDYIKSTSFNYVNSDFISYYLEILFNRGGFDKIREIINEVRLVEQLDDAGKMAIAIYRIKVEELWSDDFLSETYSRLETLELDYMFGELKLAEAEYSRESNRNKSLNLYRELLNSDNDYLAIQANYGYWKLTNYSSYLKKAVLLASFIPDYQLVTTILEEMNEVYSAAGDYKNLVVSSQRWSYLKEKRLQFLLDQHRELYQYGYDRDQLKLKIESLENRVLLYRTVIIAAVILVIVLIILLFVQSYRLRRSH